ncbi:hypothetical protein JOM56_010060 [Amanita muscaria]
MPPVLPLQSVHPQVLSVRTTPTLVIPASQLFHRLPSVLYLNPLPYQFVCTILPILVLSLPLPHLNPLPHHFVYTILPILVLSLYTILQILPILILSLPLPHRDSVFSMNILLAEHQAPSWTTTCISLNILLAEVPSQISIIILSPNILLARHQAPSPITTFSSPWKRLTMSSKDLLISIHTLRLR